MNKPIIAVDIDNVLAASAEGFIEISNKLFGEDITVADYDENWAQMWGVSREEERRRAEVLRSHRYQKDYSAIPGAREAANLLKERYELIIVTSRRRQAEELTRTWLESNFPSTFQKIVFADFWDGPNPDNGHLLDKRELYISIGAGFVIDDQLKHCLAAVGTGVNALLFGSYPWNQADVLIESIVRCDNWQAVLEYFYGR